MFERTGRRKDGKGIRRREIEAQTLCPTPSHTSLKSISSSLLRHASSVHSHPRSLCFCFPNPRSSSSIEYSLRSCWPKQGQSGSEFQLTASFDPKREHLTFAFYSFSNSLSLPFSLSLHSFQLAGCANDLYPNRRAMNGGYLNSMPG